MALQANIECLERRPAWRTNRDEQSSQLSTSLDRPALPASPGPEISIEWGDALDRVRRLQRAGSALVFRNLRAAFSVVVGAGCSFCHASARAAEARSYEPEHRSTKERPSRHFGG